MYVSGDNVSMFDILDRRFVTQEGTLETYQIPLDVKVEVILGLVLCVLGSIIANTHGLSNIDHLHFW